MMLEIGIDNIAKRVLELTEYFCKQVAKIERLKVFSSRSPGEASGIVSIAVPDARIAVAHGILPESGHRGQSPRRPFAGQSALLQHV